MCVCLLRGFACVCRQLCGSLVCLLTCSCACVLSLFAFVLGAVCPSSRLDVCVLECVLNCLIVCVCVCVFVCLFVCLRD